METKTPGREIIEALAAHFKVDADYVEGALADAIAAYTKRHDAEEN